MASRDVMIVDPPALAQSAPNRYPWVASPIHTILVLAALSSWASWHNISADHLSVAARPDRVRSYLVILFFEWLLFALGVAGVPRSRASLVLGDHWHSVRQLLRDIGIAIGFGSLLRGWVWFFGWLLRIHENGRTRHSGDASLWSCRTDMLDALSVTAGICEETIFRGYLQRHFMALTKSVPAGILFSSVALGAAMSTRGSG